MAPAMGSCSKEPLSSYANPSRTCTIRSARSPTSASWVITMMVLTLLVALSGHSGRDLVRSLVTNLRLPYRWGYAGLSGARLFPAVAAELELVRSARAVRGSAHRGRPWSPVQRFLEPVVPLLASQIRHAERQALVLESRGFGAYPMRTERAGRPWSVTDSLAVLIIWAITVVPFVVR